MKLSVDISADSDGAVDSLGSNSNQGWVGLVWVQAWAYSWETRSGLLAHLHIALLGQDFLGFLAEHFHLAGLNRL